MRIISWDPSTVSCIPSRITEVPTTVPTTQGIRYSRETMGKQYQFYDMSSAAALGSLKRLASISLMPIGRTPPNPLPFENNSG